MERMRLVAAAALAAVGVGAMWAGCESSGPQADGLSESGADAGTEGKEADSSIDDQATTEEYSADQQDGGRPCRWPGWFVMPRMPANYVGPCIPDDAAERLPHLSWTSNDAWCQGCKLLDTPWVEPNTDPNRAVWGQVQGSDAKPSLVAFGLVFPISIGKSDSDVFAVFDSSGTPLGGRRSDGHVPVEQAGSADFGGFSLDGLVLGYYIDRGTYNDHHSLVVPIAQLGDFYTSTESSLTWPKELLKHRVSNGLSFSKSTVASNLMGDVAIGRLPSAKTFLISDVPGAPAGELADSQVVGDTVFFGRYDMVKSDRWVYANDKLTLLLGDADRDFRQLVTDGTTLIWTEGSQPYFDEDNRKHFAVYDLYESQYTADPASLKPRRILAALPAGMGNLVLRNGFVLGNYYSNAETTKTAVIVVRLSDGVAWRAELAPERSWTTRPPFPAADELWGTACTQFTNCPGATVVRFPYATMEVIQTGFPDAGP